MGLKGPRCGPRARSLWGGLGAALVMSLGGCGAEGTDPVSWAAPASPPRETAPVAPVAPSASRADLRPLARPGAPTLAVAPQYPPGVRFVDVTRDWGIDLERTRAPEDGRPLMGAGVCVIDVDGLAPLDLFFTRARNDGGPALYVGSGYGNYVDESARRGLGESAGDLGCLAFDMEGDGDQDLLAFGHRAVELFENDGGLFRDVSDELLETGPRGNALYTAAAVGDLDSDGDLDIAISGYVEWDEDQYTPEELCFAGVHCEFEPSTFPNAANLLLFQQRDGRFVDFELMARQERLADGEVVVEECFVPDLPLGLPGCPGGLERYYLPAPTLALGIADFDLDGVADLFVGNDYWVPDQVFTLTEEGSFVELGFAVGLAVDALGGGMDTMGHASGDIDGDGILDHARTNFEDHLSAVHVSRGRRDLYEDEGPTIGIDRGIDTFRWAPGFLDHDLDGDLDFFEATGHYYREEYFEGRGYDGPEAQPTNLFENNGSGRFRAVVPVEEGGLALPTDSRSLNFADLDDDGRPEIILGNVEGAPTILKGVTPTTGHWLRVRLVGRGANREAVLARVLVRRIDHPWEVRDFPFWTRVRKIGEGYGGSGDPRLHFGLPTDSPVDVRVFWPDGTMTEVEGVSVDREITITE